MYLRLIFILLVILPVEAFAQTQYVSDHLVITMRSGQGNQYEIIKTLVSGTKLEVVEQTDTGYTMVKTGDGTEGWVRTQYLTDQPIAADQLAAAQSRVKSLGEKVNKLQSQLTAVRKENKQLESELATLRSAHTTASKELEELNELAARPKQLARDNKELRLQYEKINEEMLLVKQENQVLKDRSSRNWFITGAGVVILGMIIGLIIPKLRFRRKDNWSSYY